MGRGEACSRLYARLGCKSTCSPGGGRLSVYRRVGYCVCVCATPLVLDPYEHVPLTRHSPFQPVLHADVSKHPIMGYAEQLQISQYLGAGECWLCVLTAYAMGMQHSNLQPRSS